MSTELVVVAFTVVNGLRVIAYLPQIAMLLRDRSGAPGVSCTTWSLFLMAHLTTVLYAVVELRDWALAAVFALNAICCLAIVGLVILRRRSQQRSVPALARHPVAGTTS